VVGLLVIFMGTPAPEFWGLTAYLDVTLKPFVIVATRIFVSLLMLFMIGGILVFYGRLFLFPFFAATCYVCGSQAGESTSDHEEDLAGPSLDAPENSAPLP